MSVPASFGLLLIRGMVGFVMFYHGAQKLFATKFGAFGNFGGFGGGGIQGFVPFVEKLGLPGVTPDTALYFAYAAAIAEFGGGILLMLGLATRLAAIPVAITMGVAAFKVHNTAFAVKDNGMEFALTLMVVAIGLLFTGPGCFAIDRVFRRSPRPTQRSSSDRERSERKR